MTGLPSIGSNGLGISSVMGFSLVPLPPAKIRPSLGALSPRAFREVLLKNHTRILNGFEYPLIHLHPNSLYCLQDLYRISNLKVIEINKGFFGPSIFELLPTLKEVQKHKPLLIWGDLTKEEIG